MVKRYGIGCPMWQHTSWSDRFFSSQCPLKHYSQVFNTVEGNTTFYGIPSEKAVQQWLAAVENQPDFRFHFKIPNTITHEKLLKGHDQELQQFLDRMAPLTPFIGSYWLQMGPQFSLELLPRLESVLASLPKTGVEVRHLSFFDKGVGEKQWIDVLKRFNSNRIIFDSRALFSAEPKDEATIDAQRKKPNPPVHVYVVGFQPAVRFIGHPEAEKNQPYLEQWAKKFAQWIDKGLFPNMFIHTPSNEDAPLLAVEFHELLSQWVDVGAIPAWPVKVAQQENLF